MGLQQLCTFYLNGSYFGLAIEDVQEIIRQPPLTRIPLAPPDLCGLLNLRGQVIPVVDLPRRTGLRSNACQVGEQPAYNIIVSSLNDVVSFMVDGIGDVLNFASETLEPPPANVTSHIQRFLKGSYKLEQGSLLVLDTAKILDPTLTANSSANGSASSSESF